MKHVLIAFFIVVGVLMALLSWLGVSAFSAFIISLFIGMVILTALSLCATAKGDDMYGLEQEYREEK